MCSVCGCTVCKSSRARPLLEWKCDASDHRKDRRTQHHTTPHHTTPHHTTPHHTTPHHTTPHHTTPHHTTPHHTTPHHTTPHHTTPPSPTLIKHDKWNTGVRRTMFMHVTFHDGFTPQRNGQHFTGSHTGIGNQLCLRT